MIFYRKQILKDRYGSFYFQCRKCKRRGKPYVNQVTAILEKERHECA